MLATVMNCIYVSEIFRNTGMKTQILTPFECGSMTKLFSKDRANKYFERGMVVFFAGGIGHPYFSTDTTITLRAIEMDADCILLAKAIDGVDVYKRQSLSWGPSTSTIIIPLPSVGTRLWWTGSWMSTSGLWRIPQWRSFMRSRISGSAERRKRIEIYCTYHEMCIRDRGVCCGKTRTKVLVG